MEDLCTTHIQATLRYACSISRLPQSVLWPATVVPIDLVMVLLLVFEFQDKLSVSRLADALRAPRMSALEETKRSDEEARIHRLLVMYLVCLKAALVSNGANNAKVSMDVDTLRSGRGQVVHVH
jgi:hypothetical protein